LTSIAIDSIFIKSGQSRTDKDYFVQKLCWLLLPAMSASTYPNIMDVAALSMAINYHFALLSESRRRTARNIL
jgi:hypothetical protein